VSEIFSLQARQALVLKPDAPVDHAVINSGAPPPPSLSLGTLCPCALSLGPQEVQQTSRWASRVWRTHCRVSSPGRPAEREHEARAKPNNPRTTGGGGALEETSVGAVFASMALSVHSKINGVWRLKPGL